MSTFETIALLMLMGFIGWFLVGYIRKNPEMLTGSNFAKTARSLAFLAILLIGVVWLCVMTLNN